MVESLRVELRGIWQAGYMVEVERVLVAAGHSLVASDPQVILVMGLPGSNVEAARVFRAAGHLVLVLSPSDGPALAEFRRYGLKVAVIPEEDLPQALARLLLSEG